MSAPAAAPLADAWALPEPFIHTVCAAAADMDGFGHVNNAVYVRWLGEAAWAHSVALGLSEQDCQALDRGMVVRHTEIAYRAAARAGDEVHIGTWILSNDGRLRSDRAFQLRRASDGVEVARARMRFVCVTLSTGAPARMPDVFARAYAPAAAVTAALDGAPWRVDGEARSGRSPL